MSANPEEDTTTLIEEARAWTTGEQPQRGDLAPAAHLVDVYARYGAALERLTAKLRFTLADIDEKSAALSEFANALTLHKDKIETMTAQLRAAKNEGWDEACQALAWCFDNGPERDALPYLIEHNPFRATSIEQTEADRG